MMCRLHETGSTHNKKLASLTLGRPGSTGTMPGLLCPSLPSPPNTFPQTSPPLMPTLKASMAAVMQHREKGPDHQQPAISDYLCAPQNWAAPSHKTGQPPATTNCLAQLEPFAGDATALHNQPSTACSVFGNLGAGGAARLSQPTNPGHVPVIQGTLPAATAAAFRCALINISPVRFTTADKQGQVAGEHQRERWGKPQPAGRRSVAGCASRPGPRHPSQHRSLARQRQIDGMHAADSSTTTLVCVFGVFMYACGTKDRATGQVRC